MGRLRSGYTTGACAAAAAKAAVLCLYQRVVVQEVEIPFPDTSRVVFPVVQSAFQNGSARAAVIKDAGDDPDVTNGARIEVEVAGDLRESDHAGTITIKGGQGVGVVTKRGLAVAVGEPAINPVPRKMIREAVREGMAEVGAEAQSLTLTVSIVDGEKLAEQTLNKRLGIVGGLSVLGTTGIVKPISAKAWTDTISTSMDVARAAGLDQIILSTGRTSERAVEQVLQLPEESLIMMGDYLHYSLEAAKQHGFITIHLAGMWAKILKCALEIPQTHVRNGALEVDQAIRFIQDCGASETIIERLKGANTAREIYVRLGDLGARELIRGVCLRAQQYGQRVSGLEVHVYLVDGTGEVVVQV